MSRRRLRAAVAGLCLGFAALTVHAVDAPVVNADRPMVAVDPAVEAKVNAITAELRCLVCQNQTIADSHADLAVDLRNQVREMLRKGQSEKEIIAYMTARYGDFVLYRPPVKGTTMLLWFGPVLAMLVGLAALVLVLRRRSQRAPEDFDPDEPELPAADAPTPPTTAR